MVEGFSIRGCLNLCVSWWCENGIMSWCCVEVASHEIDE